MNRQLRMGILVSSLLIALTAFSNAAEARACSRACLAKVLNAYLDATAANNPSLAPLGPTYHATENGTSVSLEEGAWRSVRSLGVVQRRYFDPVEGQAAYFGLVNEANGPAIASLRLKVERHRVAEAEWTFARQTAGGLYSPEGLAAMPPPNGVIPPALRTPRAEMIRVASAYFQGLQDHDGSRIPHVTGCDRIEDGVRVTNTLRRPPPVPGSPVAGAPNSAQEELAGDCTANLKMFEHSIAAVAHRRYPLVDEAAGVVIGMTIFHRFPGAAMKRNLLTEYFIERSGKIAGIYAAMFYLDSSAPDSSGWPDR